MAALALTMTTLPVFAQQQPDAGQLLQQDRPAPSLPKTGPTLQIVPPATTASLPGGEKVTLKGVNFTGNSVFTDEQLSAKLSETTGKPYDLSGLQELAQMISEHYRAAGYPFAKAIIPEQKFTDGVLQIAIIEGRYGKVSATGNSRFTNAAQGFLANLPQGSVIESTRLERAALILDDLPGITTSPLIRPGQEFGTGDLLIDVSPTPAFKGELGLDNHNNRYTGEYRAYARLQWDSPFMLGDQLSLRSNVSNEGQWLGDLSYSVPLGTSGLRGNVSYAHTRYELAKEFSSLNATGTAKTASAGLSYPLIRSAQTNLYLAGNYQHKKLNDKLGVNNAHNDKKSHVIPLMVQFDHRDSLGGGGITYGNLSYTTGKLNLDSTLKAADKVSAKTQGSFNKLNLDVARMQATPVDNLTLFGRVSAQWADKNLDSSEDFGAGGPNGVRAYPLGEGYGDEGWLMQLETRYQIGNLAPYAFYDAGLVKINKNTWESGKNKREIAGYGLGMRYDDKSWTMDTSLAWRARGGRPTSDTKNSNPRLWVTAGWKF